MVDTSDDWIMTRIGVKERHILNEEGLGTSYLAEKAVKQLQERTHFSPDEIDAIIVSSTTPDYHFPSTASILVDKLGLTRAFAFDFQAACCGFSDRSAASTEGQSRCCIDAQPAGGDQNE
jgi:3-oxoacyl-[acyl-carrier-protein] synthase-3